MKAGRVSFSLEKEHVVSWGLGQKHELSWAEDPWSVPRDLLVSTQERETPKYLASEGISPFSCLWSHWDTEEPRASGESPSSKPPLHRSPVEEPQRWLGQLCLAVSSRRVAKGPAAVSASKRRETELWFVFSFLCLEDEVSAFVIRGAGSGQLATACRGKGSCSLVLPAPVICYSLLQPSLCTLVSVGRASMGQRPRACFGSQHSPVETLAEEVPRGTALCAGGICRDLPAARKRLQLR